MKKLYFEITLYINFIIKMTLSNFIYIEQVKSMDLNNLFKFIATYVFHHQNNYFKTMSKNKHIGMSLQRLMIANNAR